MQDEETPVPASDARIATSWPSMRYGDLEDLLIDLTGGDQKSVVGRFRNLRQMPFPDSIRTGTGKRVDYDLPRVLALCAVFELNALLIPQSHAVTITQGVWPELVRGFIAGAAETGIIPRPEGMPSGLSATVSILPDGFAPDGQPASTAMNLQSEIKEASYLDATAGLRLDCARLMSLIWPRLERCSVDPAGSALAFDDLYRGFGWGKGSVPHRGTVANLFAGSSFLDRGPYLDRAAAFVRIAATLSKDDGASGIVRGRSRRAAQNLLDYLGRPSPIDEWKGEIGTEDGGPRLKHYLAAVGEAAGLTPAIPWPATILATTTASPSQHAAALIEKALAIESAKRAKSKKEVPT